MSSLPKTTLAGTDFFKNNQNQILVSQTRNCSFTVVLVSLATFAIVLVLFTIGLAVPIKHNLNCWKANL